MARSGPKPRRSNRARFSTRTAPRGNDPLGTASPSVKSVSNAAALLACS